MQGGGFTLVQSGACSSLAVLAFNSQFVSLDSITQADLDSNGCLDSDELALTLKKPQFADTAMANYDLNCDGKVSRSEWLIAFKKTYDTSPAACKTSLKTIEKIFNANKAAAG